MILGLALALMLSQSDAASLRSSKLSPNANATIAAIAKARPIVLGRFTFATYTGPLTNSQVSICTVVFPPNVLSPGDQFVVDVGGSASNNSAAAISVGAIVQISQGVLTPQNIGFQAALPNTAGTTPVAWRSRILFGVNVPGADGQYIQPMQPLAGTVTPKPQGRSLPNASIGFAGVGDTTITDTNLTGGVYAGGHIVAGTSQSFMLATRSQIQFSNQVPIQMDVMLSQLTAATVTITVQGGTFQGL